MRSEQAVVLRARSETLADVLKGMPEQADRDRAEALRRTMSALDAAIRVPSAKE
jgi:D-alanyl-D-alanine carboxypeptidase